MNTKKVKSSAALSYCLSFKAPVITASGKGAVAEYINKIARKNDIEIIYEPFLADILTEQEIGSCIPVETYRAVAAIFAFLKKRRNSYGKD